MSPTSPDPDYDAAHEDAVRRVLWGEPEHRLVRELQESHGISEAEARALHERAMKERVAVLREGFRKRVILGAMLLCVSLVAAAFLWEVTQGFEVWTIPGRNSFTGRRHSYGPLAALGSAFFFRRRMAGDGWRGALADGGDARRADDIILRQ